MARPRKKPAQASAPVSCGTSGQSLHPIRLVACGVLSDPQSRSYTRRLAAFPQTPRRYRRQTVLPRRSGHPALSGDPPAMMRPGPDRRTVDTRAHRSRCCRPVRTRARQPIRPRRPGYRASSNFLRLVVVSCRPALADDALRAEKKTGKGSFPIVGNQRRRLLAASPMN